MLSKAKSVIVGRVRWLYETERGKRLMTIALRTPPGRRMAHFLLGKVSNPEERRLLIEAIQLRNDTRKERVKFIKMARRLHESDPDSAVRFDILVVTLLHSEEHQQTLSTVFSPTADRFAKEQPEATSIAGARISLGHEMEEYDTVLEEAHRAVDRVPGALRARLDFLKSAFAAGKMLQERDAIEFVGRQYMIVDDHPGLATDREIEKVVETFAKASIHTLKDDVDYLRVKLDREPRIGVFYLSSTQALGHAILDPYHFLALNRDRFDRFVFIGPPRSSYSPASRACLGIVEQYGDYIETHSDILMNLSWMCLGHHTVGPYGFMVDHYWSLLRAVVHRTRDKADSFRHNAWHFKLPYFYSTIGETFCERHGIDLDRPIVVMHARDEAYHAIARQSFRNSAVETYVGAINYLLGRGYQVVRLGDKKMPRLELENADYFELPFLDGYRHEIDSYLISQSRFMIGCQSGPCAFARALGVPILTVNAVLHYTLLPSTMEMACFKRYYRTETDGRSELSLIEALDARADQFDNSYRFDSAQIAVESATAGEIRAAVRDMDAWVDNPELAETPAQTEFRERVEQQTLALAAERDDLPIPIADYIGICLAGYRISPSVAEMRQPNERAKPSAAAPTPATPAAKPATSPSAAAATLRRQG